MYCVIVYYNVDMQGTDLYTTLAACGAGLLVFAVAFIWKEGVPMEDEDIEALMYEQEILNSPIKK